MSAAEILEKSIQKAAGSGWDQFGKYEGWKLRIFDDPNRFAFYKETVENGKVIRWEYSEQFSISDLILNYDFARHLWPDSGDWSNVPTHVTLANSPVEFYDFGGPLWLYHTIQMVVSGDPIAYLEQHI